MVCPSSWVEFCKDDVFQSSVLSSNFAHVNINERHCENDWMCGAALMNSRHAFKGSEKEMNSNAPEKQSLVLTPSRCC